MLAATTAVFFALFGAAAAVDHPTLPTMWVAETIDPPMGVGRESYNFVATPTESNPSTMWSNYTGCQRLIYVPGYSGTRYLLGCDAVDCCWEEQDGNQVEFQIPNVYYADPRKEVEVTYARVNITNFDEVVEADEWYWELVAPSGNVAERFWAYTTECTSCYNGIQLLQWKVRAMFTQPRTIQFKNYRGVDPESEEAKAFVDSFQVPPQCQANNLVKCPNDLNDKYFGGL